MDAGGGGGGGAATAIRHSRKALRTPRPRHPPRLAEKPSACPCACVPYLWRSLRFGERVPPALAPTWRLGRTRTTLSGLMTRQATRVTLHLWCRPQQTQLSRWAPRASAEADRGYMGGRSRVRPASSTRHESHPTRAPTRYPP